MKKFATILFLVFSLIAGATPSKVDARLLPAWFKEELNPPKPPCGGHRYYPGMNPSDSGYTQTSMTGVFINQSTGIAFNATLVPGDTLAFRPTDHRRSYFSLINVHGTPDCPIILINEGGAARVTAIGLTNCTYVKVLGTGDPGTYYGFDMSTAGGGGGQSIRVDGRSKCVEVCNIFSYKQGYGAWIKQDASCVDSLSYLMGSSSNWIIDSVDLHDCKFSNVGQDCIYAGTTVGSSSCSDGLTHYPLHISHVNLYNLIIDSCNRTGIQVSRGQNCTVHDCKITNCGYEFIQDQGVGIAIGGMSFNVRIYNDTVANTFLAGIENLGKGLNFIENNKVDSSGFLPVAWFIDIDSLIAKKDADIHSTNSLWNTGFYHLRKTGHTIINNYAQPSCIYMQPDRDINLDPYLDSSRVEIRKNKVGASVVVDGSWNYIGGNANKIVLQDFGKNPFGYYNYICENTLLDGVTAANIAAGGKHYFTDCSVFDTPPTIYKFIFRIAPPSRLKRKHLN